MHVDAAPAPASVSLQALFAHEPSPAGRAVAKQGLAPLLVAHSLCARCQLAATQATAPRLDPLEPRKELR